MNRVAVVETEEKQFQGNPKEEGITNLLDWYIFDKNTDIEKEIKDLGEHYAIVLKVVDGNEVSAVCWLKSENELDEKNGEAGTAHGR